MKSGDKLKVKLLHGEVVEAIYVREGSVIDGTHVLVASKPLPAGYTEDVNEKALIAVVGRAPHFWWECSIVEPEAVNS